MRGAKITLSNDRRFALVPRSGSYSIIWLALPAEDRIVSTGWHPINSTGNTIGSPLMEDENPLGLCCLVRNPVDRFRSACARVGVSPEKGFELINIDVHFWTLEFMGLLHSDIKHFKFPYQINECAEWLGLPTPVDKKNEEPIHPLLTTEEENIIKLLYKNDIELWESL